MEISDSYLPVDMLTRNLTGVHTLTLWTCELRKPSIKRYKMTNTSIEKLILREVDELHTLNERGVILTRTSQLEVYWCGYISFTALQDTFPALACLILAGTTTLCNVRLMSLKELELSTYKDVDLMLLYHTCHQLESLHMTWCQVLFDQNRLKHGHWPSLRTLTMIKSELLTISEHPLEESQARYKLKTLCQNADIQLTGYGVSACMIK